jgi:hypothetical protein
MCMLNSIKIEFLTFTVLVVHIRVDEKWLFSCKQDSDSNQQRTTIANQEAKIQYLVRTYVPSALMATDERPNQFTFHTRAWPEVILEIISLGVHEATESSWKVDRHRVFFWSASGVTASDFLLLSLGGLSRQAPGILSVLPMHFLPATTIKEVTFGGIWSRNFCWSNGGPKLNNRAWLIAKMIDWLKGHYWCYIIN